MNRITIAAAINRGYIPETVARDVIDIVPGTLKDGRKATRVMIDRIITDEERQKLNNKHIIGKDCVAVHRYAPEIKRSYFYVV